MLRPSRPGGLKRTRRLEYSPVAAFAGRWRSDGRDGLNLQGPKTECAAWWTFGGQDGRRLTEHALFVMQKDPNIGRGVKTEPLHSIEVQKKKILFLDRLEEWRRVCR